jgi:hypothetical protein
VINQSKLTKLKDQQFEFEIIQSEKAEGLETEIKRIVKIDKPETNQ